MRIAGSPRALYEYVEVLPGVGYLGAGNWGCAGKEKTKIPCLAGQWHRGHFAEAWVRGLLFDRRICRKASKRLNNMRVTKVMLSLSGYVGELVKIGFCQIDKMIGTGNQN